MLKDVVDLYHPKLFKSSPDQWMIFQSIVYVNSVLSYLYCRSYYFRQQRFSGDESHDVQSVPVSTGKSGYCIPHCIGILVMRRDHDILL